MKLPHLRVLALIAAYLLFLIASPGISLADDHLVPLTELQSTAQANAASRETNLSDLNRVLALPAAQDALQKSKVSSTQVNAAVAQLSDEELANLAAKARLAEKDVEGGLIVGLLALIGLVVVIIIVVSLVS